MWNLQTEADECLRQVQALGIEISPITSFDIAYKVKSWWGKCYELQDGTYRIDINSRLLSGDVPVRGLRTVLFHEILHASPGCYNHGKEWKAKGKIIEKELGYKIQTRNSGEELGVKDSLERNIVPEKIPEDRLLHLQVGDFIAYEGHGNGVVVDVKPIGRDAMLEIAFLDGCTIRIMQKPASLKVQYPIG